MAISNSRAARIAAMRASATPYCKSWQSRLENALMAALFCTGIALAWAIGMGVGMFIAGIFCAAGASASFATACNALAAWGIASGIAALAGMGVAIKALIFS